MRRAGGACPPKIRISSWRTGEDRRDRRRGRSGLDPRAELDAVQLEVVDGRDGRAVAVEHLAVQQVQVRVEDAPSRRARIAARHPWL